jgi:3-deoxy-D-manno-octulosonic-acid transferase
MPFIIMKLFWRGYKAPEYRARRLERLGLFKAPNLERSIWVHAVSVGEVLAAEPVIRALQKRFPERDIVITSMTPTSSEQIHKLFGGSVFHVYAPYDLPFMVNAFFRRIKPEFLIIMETELWPNMIHQARQKGCPVVIVNARLSARSANGYHRLKPAIGWMLNELSLVLCQNENDASRFRSLGISGGKIHVTGSVKYDLNIDPGIHREGRMLRQSLRRSQPIWIAASTHEGEDARVLATHLQLREFFPDAVLILVPRHPERFDSAFSLSEQAGFITYRRTHESRIPKDVGVFVVDTMGELMNFYAASDIAFIGGSLVEVGGHNPIEPGALGLPILAGPHVFNFEAICEQLVSCGGMDVVQGEAKLLASLKQLMADPESARQRGQYALKEVNASKGAVNQVVDYLAPLLEDKR